MADIKAKPEFAALSEAEMLAAIDTPDPCNPVVIEYTRLVGEYAEQVRRAIRDELAGRKGGKPRPLVLHWKPRNPIERFATGTAKLVINTTMEKRGGRTFEIGDRPEATGARSTEI